MPRMPFTVIQDSDEEDGGNLSWTQTADFGIGEHEVDNSGDRENEDEVMYGFNEEEELGLAVAEDEEGNEVGQTMGQNGVISHREEEISTLSLQQEIQKQHAALLASSTIHTSTTTSMTEASSKHPATADEDFPPSSPKRRKTTHDIPEPKQSVWEFYADSEVDSDYGTPKRKKTAKSKDATIKPKNTRSKTAPALVFDEVLGGPIAPPVIVDDENDADFVPEGIVKKRGRKNSEQISQIEKKPNRGKTIMTEAETVNLLSSGDEAAATEHRSERHSSPQAPASSFQVAVPSNAMATQEREQYQVYPPTAMEDPAQEQQSTLVLPPYNPHDYNPNGHPAMITTSQAMASTVPDSNYYRSTPVMPPTAEPASESNASKSSDNIGQPKSFQGNSDFDPTPPNQPKRPIEKVVEPEPVETLELVREIAKEEFGLRRKPTQPTSSVNGAVIGDLEADSAKLSPNKGKQKLATRNKIKLQTRAKTTGDIFDFDFDEFLDEKEEEEEVSKPKSKPRKKKGLLALNDEEDEDWAGETPTKGRKKAAEKKPPAEKKPRGRPRKKPKPLIEEEEEQPEPATSDPPTTDPQTSSAAQIQRPPVVQDSDEDFSLSPLSELGSDFGDDDRFDDLLPKSKSKSVSKNALSELVNMSSPPRLPMQSNTEVSKEEGVVEMQITKKDTRKRKNKTTTAKKKAVSPSPLRSSSPSGATEGPQPGISEPAPGSKSGAKIKLKRTTSKKKIPEILDSDEEEEEEHKSEAEVASPKKACPPPPPVTPAKPHLKAEESLSTPSEAVTPVNQIRHSDDKSLAPTIKQEAMRKSVTPGSEGKLSWQQARYRVGLSKRQRIEPLHGYLKKGS